MTDKDIVIKMEHVNKDYRIIKRSETGLKHLLLRTYIQSSAVRNLNIEIEKGEIIGFLGPNGAGKSTTIKMLCGILAPTSGVINVLGNDPFTNRKKNAYKIGAVFGQRSQLWWDLPVCDTFQLLRKIYKVSDDTYEETLQLFKKYLELDSIWLQPVRQLSLGQRMKAEFAAAILHKPEILFLDEPTIGLDIVAKKQIRQFIKELNRVFQTTVILTSHDMKDIEELSNHIIIIDKGEVIYNDTIAALKQLYNDSAVLHITFKQPIDTFPMSEAVEAEAVGDGCTWRIRHIPPLWSTIRLIDEVNRHLEIESFEKKTKDVEDIVREIYQYGIYYSN
ncbi:ATP-binding cassette domain-containing protein [Paenibacillus sp. S150]|uniref:ABC transporter ATP-binding protein n=1 Tax=Paenibacillus sp. S150 TaxID=2749826 RepID=UPI001C58B50E|nr:ATP-binding cassette domain-containing protein [Paenibacillus sp. S150]MBW4085037.1 ATP-binding cassette domain-containing protein [Paenibacillus sp. S150]